MGAKAIAKAGEFTQAVQWAPAKNWLRLAAIALDAGVIYPPNYFASILGCPDDWRVTPSIWSEFTVLDRRKLRRMVRYLTAVAVPGLTLEPPAWALPPFDRLIFRPTKIYPFPEDGGSPRPKPKESWIFINGVATNYAVAKLNAEYLMHLFHRPITVVHNSTAALSMDLLECAVGKGWKVMTEPAIKAFGEVVGKLNDERCERLVVICHSQGTIIMANVLRALVEEPYWEELLAPLPPRERVALRDHSFLGKLEIYAFATCADVMQYTGRLVRHGDTKPIPWIEHFGNERDLVARLGMLAPNKTTHEIEIDGPQYCRADAWGHLLNEHYLIPMERHLRDPELVPNPYPLHPESSARCPAESRLYGYFRGGG